MLNRNCIAVIQRKLLTKMEDQGCYTIPIQIRKHDAGKGLCDLGTSINVMPFAMVQHLYLGEIKPANIILQLVDRSITHPVGILKYMIVRAGQLLFPADFVIFRMEEDTEMPLILGRPLLCY